MPAFDDTTDCSNLSDSLEQKTENSTFLYQPQFTIKDFQAPHFQDARAGISLWRSPFESKGILHGIPVSSGIGIGKAYFLHRKRTENYSARRIAHKDIEREIMRMQKAISKVVADFAIAREKVPTEFSEQAAIINAHIMICQDPKLLSTSVQHVREELLDAEEAIKSTAAEVRKKFSKMDSDYLRERMHDIQLVADHIIAALNGNFTSDNSPLSSSEKVILFAHNLSPADTFSLSPGRFLAIATELGGKTAHTGILARSLNIPCIAGVDGLESMVADGDIVIVDALKGQVLINPDESELARYTTLKVQLDSYEKRIRKEALLPAETTDGVRLKIYGNVEKPDEVGELLRQGAEGVGLYRTEFGFMHSETLPTEEELYNDYKGFAESMQERHVVFRTLDVGSDKMLALNGAKTMEEEENPALGLRSIRYCLRHKDIFRTQLRAILRASVHENVAILFPLISGLSELKQAKAVLNETRQELRAENLPFDHNIPLGIMIELPSAVLMADVLAREVDFFSIGTNDLIQYSLGIDRDNKHVAYLYQPLHPAIIRAIKYVTDMAHKAGISVAVCGEMASDPYCLPILMAIGIDELSMSPQSIPGIKHLIRNSSMTEYTELLRQTSTLGDSRDILKLIRQCLYQRFHNELGFFATH